MNNVLFAITSIFVVVTVFLGIAQRETVQTINHISDRLETFSEHEPTVGVALPGGEALFQTSLQDRITDADTSMTLVSASTTSGESIVGYHCFTIDEGRSDVEYACGTLSGGRTVTSLERGISLSNGTTTSTSRAHDHRKGSNVKITDYPLIQRMRNALNGDETIPNSLLLDSIAQYTSALTITPGSNQLASALYADNIAAQGAATSSESVAGIVSLATALEAASSTQFSANDPHVLNSTYATDTPTQSTASASKVVMSDLTGYIKQAWINLTDAFTVTGPWFFADTVNISGTTTMATTTQNGAMFGANIVNDFVGGIAGINGATTPVPVMLATSTNQVSPIDSDVASTTAPLLGFVINNCGLGTTCHVQTDGIVKGFSGLTAGAEYYVSNTAGVLSTTIGASENYVGRAVSTSAIQIDKSREMQYLGSQSIPEDAVTVINQPWARHAIISASTNTGSSVETYRGDVTISKFGKTSGVIGGGTIGGASDRTATHTFTWSGMSITSSQDCSGGGCTGDGVGSGTAYYYK